MLRRSRKQRKRLPESGNRRIRKRYLALRESKGRIVGDLPRGSVAAPIFLTCYANKTNIMAIIHPKDAITIFKGGKNRKTVVRKRVRSPAFHPLGKITSHKGGNF